MEEQLKMLIKQAVKEVIEEMNLINTKEEILNARELAEWLGVSPAWVSVNKDKKHIPHFDAGGDKFYRSDIEKWIEENKNEIRPNREVERPNVNIRVVKSKSKVI